MSPSRRNVYVPASNLLLAGIFGAALLLACALTSCSKKPRYEDARLSIEPASADFGTIQANDLIAFHDVSLALINLGNKPLSIEDIELPEGFSYTLVPRNKMETGDKASLKITIDIRKFSGTLSETAYVVSNDPSQPRMPLTLQGEIVGERTDQIIAVGNEPDIEFDHKILKLGNIGRHQTLVHDFEFKNVGKEPLKIISIETFCRCLIGRPTKAIVPPGESSAIAATLEAYKWRAGFFRKSLLIATNDPDEPSITLTLVANIIDVITVEPKEVLLPNIQLGQPAVAEAKIMDTGQGKLTLQKIEASSPNISATWAPLAGDEEGYLLTLTVGPDMPEGKFEEIITIYANYEGHSSKKSPENGRSEKYTDVSKMIMGVRGSIIGAISITPQTLHFGTAQPGESMHRKLFISSTTSSFEIETLSISDPEFRTSYAPIEPGQKYEITVEFIPGTVEREIMDTLVITTSNTTAEVPIFATVGSKSQ